MFKSILFYIAGVFIGWPTLLTNFKEHYGALFTDYHDYIYPKAGLSYIGRIYIHLTEIIHIFGLPLAVFIFGGLLYCFSIFFKRSDIRKDKIAVLLSPIVAYITLFSLCDRPPAIKYMILISSALAVIGGLAVYKFLVSFKFYKIIKYFLITVSFIFSFFYTLSSDYVFAKKDTRYEAAEWINKNIFIDSTIEIFTQPAWVLSAEIFPKHNIVFLGKSSFETNNFNIYNAFKDGVKTYANLEDYFKIINQQGLSSDYILIPYFEYLNKDFLLTGPQGDKFVNNLLNGKMNCKLIKKFSLKTYWYWNLKGDYTSPTLLLFKRNNIQ